VGGSETAKVSGSHPAEAGRGSETILLVEDDAMIRTLATEILKMQGYRVVPAEHGAEALEVARAKREVIHLLITDVVMPKMGGRELAEVLMKERPGIKVLFTSGYTENAILNHGMLEEGLSFIQKPYTPFSLAQKVRQMLDAGKE
jgi:CheY-like chemotaxis protein